MTDSTKKVLLVQPRTLDFFWSCPEINKMVGLKATIIPLGLITVAALLPKEWNLRLVDLNVRPLTEDDWTWAEMIMLSGMIVHRKGLLAVAGEARSRGKTVVVGGPYVSSVSDEELKDNYDYAVEGEAESSLPLFLEALGKGIRPGKIAGERHPSLNSSPIPRFELLDLEAYGDMAVQTTRGCPFDCEFCNVVSLFGRRIRHKPIDQVIKELEVINDLGWRGEIFIVDDNFIGDKEYARAFLEKLTSWSKTRGEPFSFITQATVNLGQDKALIDLMTAANFGSVFLGIESPDEEVLKQTHKLHNLTHPMNQSIFNVMTNGLNVIGSFIIGFDHEKPGTDERICRLVDSTGIPLVMINLLAPLPNTRLWRRLKDENRLLFDSDFNESVRIKLNYRPARSEKETIAELLKTIDYLYAPEHYLERVRKFCLTIRPTRRAQAKAQGQKPARTPLARPPLRRRLKDLRALSIIIWRQGIRAPIRRLFWRNLIIVLSKNPSRIKLYFRLTGHGEDLFKIRADTIREYQVLNQ
ncbi:MAG: B12-binding domain-containing radical SAM protein [Thermodesulfobacteriota bacterium]